MMNHDEPSTCLFQSTDRHVTQPEESHEDASVALGPLGFENLA